MKKMKHLLLSTLIFAAVIMLVNVCVLADFSGREEDVEWKIDTSNGTLTVSVVGDMPEYEFGEAPWYKYSASVKSIVVRQGLSSISYGAFYGLEYVESLTVPFVGDGNSNPFVGYIFGAKGYYANNTFIPENLKTITVTNATIPSYAFNNCYSIEEVILGDFVESIGSYAFTNCSSLERVVLGSSVSSIDSNAFNNCTALEQVFYNGTSEQWKTVSVNATNSITPITLKGYSFTVTPATKTVYKLGEKFSNAGINATFGDTNVTNDVIITPPDMTAIGTATYTVRYGSLIYTDEVTVTANDTSGVVGGITWSFDNGTLTLSGEGVTDNYTLEILPPWYQYRNSIETIVVGDGIESIGDYAFYAHKEVETITVSESVETIGYAAFEGCIALESLTIGNADAVVDATAFRGCDSLVVEDVDGNEYVAITGNDRYMLKSIADKGASSFTIPSNTVIIGEKAFEGCIGAENVTIPNSVISIGDGAFRDCTNIETVQFGTNVKLVGNSAFDGCTSLTTVKFNATPKTIGVQAFAGCPLLDTAEYDNALYIGSESNPYMVLISAKNIDITSCTLHPNTKVISALAFANCKKLATVDLCEGLKAIGNSAFNGCSALYSIDIPYSTEYIGSLAFNDCTGLATATIGGFVEYIGNGAFRAATSLKSVVLPFSLKNLGYNAFRECTSLTTVGISDGVKAIGYKAFEGCTSLENVFMPDSLNTIGDYAFMGCTSLQNIAIPHTVVAIGFGAFSKCNNLRNIVLPFAGERVDGSYPFIGYVFGATSAQSNASAVSGLGTVLVGGNISANAFNGVEITTLILDKTVNNIDANAFGTVSNVYYLGTSSEWSAVNGNNQFSSVIFLDNSFTVTPTNKKYQVGDMVDLAGFTAVSGELDVMSLIRLGSNPLVESGDNTDVPVYLGTLKSSFNANVNGHITMENYSLTLEGCIGIKAYVKLTPFAILNFDDIVTTVTYKEKIYPATLVNAGDENDSTLYYTKFYVAAKDMQENITFTFDMPGATYSETVSVKKYVDYVNKYPEEYADSIALVNAMYNYGEYSRAYFTGADDITPNPDLSDTTINISSNYSPVKVGSVSGISIVGSSLLLESSTTLRHYFELGEDASIEDYTFTVDGTTQLTPKQKENYYYVDVENILAHKLGEMRVVAVKKGNETAKFVYGPLSYAKTVLDNPSFESDLALVVKALYNYYVESRNYYKLINAAPIIPEDNESGYQIW